MNIASLTTPAASSRGFARTIPGRVLLGLAATLIVALAAHVSIPLWFTPVPFTLQPLAVLAIGLVLGPVDGFCVMIAYLAEGVAGLPVFAPTPISPGGVAQLVGFTGGFLMAYPFVAAVAGGLVRLLSAMPPVAALRAVAKPPVAKPPVAAMPRFLAAVLAATAASVLLFVCGAGWFAHLTHLSGSAVYAQTVAPFVIGGILHIVAAATVYRLLSPRSADV
jgi:biotin transport system substrate-specific component